MAPEQALASKDTVKARTSRRRDADPVAHAGMLERAAIDGLCVRAPRRSSPTPTTVPDKTGHTRRTFRAWSNRYVRRLALADALVGLVAVLVVATWAPGADAFDETKTIVLAAAAALAWPTSLLFSRGYERSNAGVGSDEINAVLHAAIFSIAAGAVPSAITARYGLVSLVVTAVPLAFVLSMGVRVGFRRRLHVRQRLGHNLRRTLLVGQVASVAELAYLVQDDAQTGMAVVGVCVPDSDVAEAERLGLAVLGKASDVRELVLRHGIDAVAVGGADTSRRHQLRELAWSLEGVEVELLVHPGLVEVAGPRMHLRPYVGLPLLVIEQPDFSGWRHVVKRAFDVALTTVGLLVAASLLLVVAAAIKLSDGGPVFFRQRRVGLDGSSFTMLKFRSMFVDAEQRLAGLRAAHPEIGVMFKMTDDPRVTRVGRFLRMFSLDELPQLLNVLTGSMSLVGPRPPLPGEVEGYASDARRRLLVTPGMTGLWQVSGRSLLSWEETVRLDLRYVENWTLSLDVLILWKTFFAVVGRRGAY